MDAFIKTASARHFFDGCDYPDPNLSEKLLLSKICQNGIGSTRLTIELVL
jgi:hypothetical protein